MPRERRPLLSRQRAVLPQLTQWGVSHERRRLPRRPPQPRRAGVGAWPLTAFNRVGWSSLAVARASIGAMRPRLDFADGTSIDAFALGPRLGRRAVPLPGSRYHGTSAGVFRATRVPSGVTVALKVCMHSDAGVRRRRLSRAAARPHAGYPAAAVRVRGAMVYYDKQGAWCLLWTMLSTCRPP